LAPVLTVCILTGCGHPKQARVNVPPPPAPEPSTGTEASKETGADLAEPTIPLDARPIATETGKASWYGPPYHNRKGSNGEVYNMHAMTAAHRTLPLGSIVRVTNLKTRHTALVRITDRGPFIQGRILDLSLAAAKKLDVYLPGTAEVKVEVMQTPVPIETGGRWAVQIGAFAKEGEARRMADQLTRRYRTAKVQSFGSPVGDWWVRVRVVDDDREAARKLVAETRTSEGAAFLVRLD
jgi:rare lipoprotein A